MEPLHAQKKKEEHKAFEHLKKEPEFSHKQERKGPAPEFFAHEPEHRHKPQVSAFFGHSIEKGVHEEKKKKEESEFLQGARKRHEHGVKIELDSILSGEKLMTLHESILKLKKKKKRQEGGSGGRDDDDEEDKESEDAEDEDKEEEESSED